MSKQEEKKCICCLCGESLPEVKFYKSYSKFYHSGHLPICKECFARRFGQYLVEYHSSKKAMQRMCMAFDIFFDEDLFDKCDTNDDTVVGNYFRKLNMAQYKGKTFENTINNGFDLSGDRKPVKEKRVTIVDQYGNEHEDEKINPKDIEKWGIGFEPIDYNILNSHYKYLKSSNPRTDNNQEIFILDCCYTKMQQLKAVREGRSDDYAKLTDLYAKTYKTGGLKATGDTGSNDDFTIGVTAETIEKYTPAEFYKNKRLYEDYDGLGEYIKRHLLRPLKNLMFGSRDKDDEWHVKEDEEGEYDD